MEKITLYDYNFYLLTYTDKDTYTKLLTTKANGPLAIIVSKMYHKPDHLSFDAFGRILSGTISKGDNIR